MKSLAIVFALTMIVAASAQAKLIAQASQGGGMPAPSACGMHKVNIDDTGVVTAQACETGIRQIAKLSPATLKNLVNKINSIEITDLVRPTGAGCADAPSTFYSVSQKDGSMKPISARINCEVWEMAKGSNFQVENVRDLLQGFISLANF
jgi:hypothetical protein